ncbi:rod shape-determining protein MreC [Thioalbus denitrificans]|uniref:Cell shape-determining protein MreC n=1 Tax=Thioalbus denitrificans TaxID=547122 RepID=A0A369CAP3_9GAMM|nr:rod shape-determining protein MreC [Thioalbus denitrificans]
MRLILLIVLSVVLMTMDHRLAQMAHVRSALSLVLAPIQYLVNFPVVAGRWFTEGLSTRRDLIAENANLKAGQLLLRAQVQKLEALESENRRLRELLHSGSRIMSERVLIAELLAVDADPFTHQIVLNKGSRDGAFKGQPLLDSQGVMGQVVEVGPITSRALLITDASHAIPVQVNRNGIRAVALGTGAIDRLELAHVPDTADIRPGDLLITSGLGGRFPPGYPVGTVVEVTHDPGQAYALITARPSARLDRSREVLLVWPRTQTAPVEAETGPEPEGPEQLESGADGAGEPVPEGGG